MLEDTFAENVGFGDFEFERRFLVKEFPEELRDSPSLIIQNYFLAKDGFAIRVRCLAPGIRADINTMSDYRGLLLANKDHFDFAAITVKGPAAGGTRYEAERAIDPGVGVDLVARGDAVVVKTRYAIWYGEDGWVVDEFGGNNTGLIIAECERSSPVTDLQIPSFCTNEITDDYRFANDSLCHNPYRVWGAAYERELQKIGSTFRQDFGTNR
jgi:CYTH domain-containing protein